MVIAMSRTSQAAYVIAMRVLESNSGLRHGAGAEGTLALRT